MTGRELDEMGMLTDSILSAIHTARKANPATWCDINSNEAHVERKFRTLMDWFVEKRLASDREAYERGRMSNANANN